MKLALLSLLLLLVSCGGKRTQTTEANIVILGGIASGIPGMTGGTKIYGYNNSTGDTLNLTYSGQQQITLPNGTWGFTAITWDGITANGSGQVLEGDVKCGSTPDMDLNGGDVVINMTLSNAGCNDEFLGESGTKETNGEFKKFIPNKCMNAKAIEDEDETCIRSVAESYIVSLPDGQFGGTGLSSRCLDQATITNPDMTADANAQLRIPLISWFDGSFSIEVQLFDGAGCTGSSEIYTIINPYAGHTLNGKLAKFPGGGTQGDGNPNHVRFFNNPCLNGEGTGASPFNPSGSNYTICTEAQLEGASGIEANLAGTYDLLANLDFTGYGAFTTSLVSGSFTGVLNGNGKTISNVTINATSPPSPLGIFQQINGTAPNTEVQGLNLNNISVTSFEGGAIGSLVGQIGAYTRIERVLAENITVNTSGSTGPYYCVGGLVGDTNGGASTPAELFAVKMTNVTMDVGDNFTQVGGITGCLGNDSYIRIAKISNLTLTDSGTTGDSIGGAVGYASSTTAEIYGVYVDNATIGSSGTPISTSRSNIGGLIGQSLDSRIFDNKVTGTLYADSASVGGLVGSYSGTGTSDFVGNITDIDLYVGANSKTGGLVGEIYKTTGALTFDTNRSLGSVDCLTQCGGLIGRAEAVGTANINISKSFSKSNVTSINGSATAMIGGLVGYLYGNGGTITLDDSYASNVVTTSNAAVDEVGGLIGKAQGPTVTINDTYTNGTVDSSNTGPASTGGLIGHIDGCTMARAYSTATVTNGDECNGTFSNTPTVSQTYGIIPGIGCATSLSATAILDISNLTGFGTNWDDVAINQETKLDFEITLSGIGENFTGTFFDPIILTSANQWNAIGDNPFLMNKDYQLGADLSFGNADCGAGFEPIGSNTNPFVGNFKGHNHVISDINCTESAGSEHLGLFRKIGVDVNHGAGEIQDFDVFDYSIQRSLYVDNVHFSTDQGSVGIIVGQVVDDGTAGSGHEDRFAFKMNRVTVTNSSVDQTGAFRGGGLIGIMTIANEKTSVQRSDFEGSLSGGGSALEIGGIIGRIDGTLAGGASGDQLDFAVLSFEGDITTTSTGAVGGIVGEQAHADMEMAYASSDIVGSIAGNNNVGGFAGRWTDGAVRNSYAKGAISAVNAAGLFIGHLDGNTTNPRVKGNYAEGTVNFTGTNGGCLIGLNSVTPILYNNYANCSSVGGGGSPASYFANGGFTLFDGSTQSKNTYAATTDEVITDTNYVTYAQLADDDYVTSNTELDYGDPWFTGSGGLPRQFWEVYPEALGP